MKRTALTLAGLAAGTALLAGCGSTAATTPLPMPTETKAAAPAAPVGFNDPYVLAADFEQTVNAKQTDGATVTITCIPTDTPHKFVCNGQWSDDTPSQSVDVTVSPDGNTWISS